ncbi:hypothetical protein EDC01DRAFT_664600 [Geopyxis carbonaria]|nr:hypothetical protein EDC01DRAFT_664600 [Geopyxis carbonaria]
MRATTLLARRLPSTVPRHQLWKPSIRHTRLYSASALGTPFSTTHVRRTFQQYTRHPGAKKFAAIWFGSSTVLAFAVPVVLAQEPEPEPEPAFHNGSAKTIEQQMLELSEKEKKDAKSVPEGLSLPWRVLRSIVVLTQNKIIEPLATGFRFLKLVCIFAPLILSIPVVYCGQLVTGRNGGTLWWYGFLVSTLETAGPTFIKLGQWAASRTDVFPTELCDLMSKLHSNAKPHSFGATKRIISKAFGGRQLDEIFEEFDETPLGVGAIAQVYRAKVKPDFIPPLEAEPKNFRQNFREKVDGLVKSAPAQSVPSSYVAIKVIHPRVDKTVNRDLRIMRFFAVVLDLVPTLEWFSFPDEVDTFSEMMRLQMDLRIEAENLAKFRSNFDKRTTVTFPIPYRDFTTRDVLIEEFVHGMPLSAFLENGGGVFQEDIANMGLDAFLHMLVMDNFIHSDLHPGNIMIRFLKPNQSLPLLSRIPFFLSGSEKGVSQNDNNDVTTEVYSRLKPHAGNIPEWTAELAALDKDGYRPQLVFIDAGLVTELNQTNRKNFLDLFRAIAEFDGYRAGHLMIARSRSPLTVLDGEVFALKMQHLVLTVKSRTLALGQISFGDILSDVLSMVRTHHVRMEGDFVNVVLSMLLLEGIGRSLDPEMDLLKSSLPMLRAVGAGTGRTVLSGGGPQSAGETSGALSLLKVWVALETRQLVTSSIHDVENLVKYDLLSPNI